ncbi:hypothetical protein FOCG_17645 [Fusarium oxysporum f. sp. radicis-lycopersici 26381]|nr:hypothetical protein FOCG_17645 [Fusarium oxysporum f. sp. radicis-lycopersici 26381]
MASSGRDQDFETKNAELRSKISDLRSEIRQIQCLLDSHKNCAKYPQNTSSLDSKAAKTMAFKCPA